MIWSTYHVFGSGSSGVRRFAKPEMKLSEYVTEFSRLTKLGKDEGNNGFIGIVSVPDDEGDKIVTSAWFYPGSDGVKYIDGYTLVEWRCEQIRQFLAVIDCSVLTLHEIKANRTDEMISILGRRVGIISSTH